MSSSTLEIHQKKKESTILPKPYYYILIGDIVSRIGDYIYQIGIPLLIYYITSSSVWMGVAFAVEQSALIITGLFAGTIVDRSNPKKVVMINSLLQTVAVCAIPLLYSLGLRNIYIILAIGFLLIASNFVYRTAINSLTPSVVKKEQLPHASGQFSLGRSVSKVLGPVIAGFLVTTLSPVHSLWIDGLTFLVIFIFMSLIKESDMINQEHTKDNEKSKRTFWEDFKEGFALLVEIPSVLPLILLNFMINLGFVSMFAMMVFHLKDTLGMDSTQIGFVFAADGVGAFVAGLVLPNVMKKIKNGFLVLIGSTLMGLSILLLGYTQQAFIVGILFGLVMFSSQIINRTIYTLWQMQVQKNKLGRIFGTATMIESLSVPLAGMLSGLVVKHHGSFFLMKSGGITVILVVILIYIFTNIRTIDNRS